MIGPNGAGKSTLIKQICGQISSDSGKVIFDGRDLGGMDVAERAKAGLGRTFQVSSLVMEFSALRNVMLAVQSKRGTSYRFFKSVRNDNSLTDPAMAALKRVNLEERAHIMTAELSHGERRQLEIAMALALDPKPFCSMSRWRAWGQKVQAIDQLFG